MDYRKIFLPPVYDNLERSQKAAFLHFTLIISTAALSLFGFLNLYWNAITLGWMLLGISGFCIVGIILNKTNHYYLAAILFAILIFIAIFYNLVDGAALHDPGIAALPIFLLLVSIFFGRSVIPFYTLVSILGIIAIYFFWTTGLLILSQPPTINRVAVLSILQVVTGIFSWMVVSTQGEIMGELDLSEERFRTLFMAAPLGIAVTSRDGKMLVYNDSLALMSGYTHEEFKLLNVQDHYENLEDRNQIIKTLETTGVVRAHETRFLHKDKTIFNVSMSIIPLKYGEEDALLTIIEDISERKQAELERQEELDFRKLLVDSSPIFFVVVNRQGKTTMMNKSMLGALGYKWEQVREAEYINTFVPEREQPAVLKAIEEVFDKSKTTLSENHILTKTGQELLVEWHACPIINPEEKIEFIFTYGVDITERKKTENELKESAERYRDLIDNMPISFVIHADEKILFMNPMGLKTMGISDLEDVIGVSIWEFMHPEMEEIAKLNLEITYEQRRATDTTFGKFIRLNGEVFDTEIIGIPMMYKGQQATQTVFQDITKRKQAELELRESEDKFHEVFMKSPYPMTIARLDDGVYVDVNEGFEKNLGYSREEMIGHSAMDLGLFKDPYAIEKMNRIIAKEGGSKDLELIFLHKDGQELISLVSSEIIELNGEPHRVSIGKNITKLRESERALIDSEMRYRTLFEGARDAIFIIKDNRVIDCNNAVLNNFGYTREEIIGKHPGEVSPSIQPDGQESTSKAEALHQKVREGFPQIYEWVHQRKDGSEFTAEVNLHQVVIQDETLTLAIVRDVTERKLTEQAAREERQRLARDLHDAVSQTMWSASLIADVLPDVWEQDPVKGHERLVRLRQLTRGALAEMRGLLLELRPSALIETKMVELLKQLIEATISRSGAQISMDFEGECALPEDVHVAFYRIAQETLNNAIRHAMAFEIKIRMRCGPKYARLEIDDNGCGFDPESTPTGQHLGLIIMRERASSIGADLEIISRSDEGTKVVLIWPDDGEVNDD